MEKERVGTEGERKPALIRGEGEEAEGGIDGNGGEELGEQDFASTG